MSTDVRHNGNAPEGAGTRLLDEARPDKAARRHFSETAGAAPATERHLAERFVSATLRGGSARSFRRAASTQGFRMDLKLPRILYLLGALA